MQLFLAALEFAHRRDDHAVGFLPHHFARRQVCAGHDRFADQLLGLIELGDPGQDLARGAAVVVQLELEQFFALRHVFARKHLAHRQFHFAELID